MELLAEPHPVCASRTALLERSKVNKPFQVISLFSGCGGMDLGFTGGFSFLGREYSKLPFEIIWANELNPRACATYRANLGDHIIEGDIWKSMDLLPQSADLVIGGFPCQDVSVNGKGAGADGKRTGLYRAMVDVIDKVHPKVFVAENVKGLLTRKHEKDLAQILNDFSELKYNLSYGLYLAHEYGVPQTRERVFIVGTRSDVPEFVPPQVQLLSDAFVTAKTALQDLESLAYSEEFSHIWSLAASSPEQGCRRLKAERPGYTVRAECHGNIQFHYKFDRRISMREAARLQSFPDSFRFMSKLRETERQVGNAVPPVLAWHVANQVAKLLS